MTITIKRSAGGAGGAGIEKVLAHADSGTLTSERVAAARRFISRLSEALANEGVPRNARTAFNKT